MQVSDTLTFVAALLPEPKGALLGKVEKGTAEFDKVSCARACRTCDMVVREAAHVTCVRHVEVSMMQ